MKPPSYSQINTVILSRSPLKGKNNLLLEHPLFFKSKPQFEGLLSPAKQIGSHNIGLMEVYLYTLTLCILVDFSAVICWMSILVVLVVAGLFCHFILFLMDNPVYIQCRS